jgi:hypothetical protein
MSIARAPRQWYSGGKLLRKINFTWSPKPLLPAVLFLALAGGCNRKPYVPYSIDDAGSAAAPTSTATGTLVLPTSGGGSSAQTDTTGPLDTFGVHLVPPDGQRFRSAYVGPGGASQGVLVLAEGRAAGKSGLFLYHASQAGVLKRVSALTEMIVLEGCNVQSSWNKVGTDSVTLDARVKCPAPEPAGPSRSFSIVSLAATEAKVRVSAILRSDPHAGRSHDSLTLRGYVGDLDGDSVPDARITFAEGSAPDKPEVERDAVSLSWFDRPQGMTRNAADPSAAFQSTLEDIRRDAAADRVTARALSLRRSWALLCGGNGNGLLVAPNDVCEAKPLGPLEALLVSSWAKGGDYGRAFALLELAELERWPQAARQEANAALMTRMITVVKNTRTLKAVADVDARGNGSAWGLLHFEADGALVVRTREGSTRLPADLSEELATPQGAAPRAELGVVSAGGERLLNVYDGCDGLLYASIMNKAHDETRELPIKDSMGTAGTCNSRTSPRYVIKPLLSSESKLEASVGALPVFFGAGFATAERAPPGAKGREGLAWNAGSGRSPNKEHAVIPTALGLWLQSSTKQRLLVPAKGSPLTVAMLKQAEDCTINDKGDRVACLVAGQVMLFSL